MLTYPQTDTLRVIAFDPSLKNLGVACGEIYLGDDNKVVVEYATTYYVDKLLGKFPEEHLLTKRTQLTEKVKELAINIITEYNPYFVVSEKPVYSGNPETYANQWEGVCALRTAAVECTKNPLLDLIYDLEFFHVGHIKATVDVANTSGDKTLMTEGLQHAIELNRLDYKHKAHTPQCVDEHANDAVAMLLTKARHLFNTP